MIRLRLPAAVFDSLAAHARSEFPNECCGLLSGTSTETEFNCTRAIPLINELHSPIAFRSEARSMFQALKSIRENHEEDLAVYHSHPTTEPIPSKRDLEELNDTKAITVIITLKDDPPKCRAWKLVGREFQEVEIEIT